MKSKFNFLKIAMFIWLLYGGCVFSQFTYTLEIKNDSSFKTGTVENGYFFDVYLKSTGSDFTLSGVQMGIKIDTNIRNGGFLKAEIISGYSDLNTDQQQTSANLNITGSGATYGLKITAKTTTSALATLITQSEKRVFRIKLTNFNSSTDLTPREFRPNSQMNLRWCNAGNPYPTKVSAYNPTSMSITDTTNHLITFRNNPLLNVPSGPTAPTAVNVDVNNFCSNAGGNITLTATGGSGTTLAWYSVSCGGTPVGTGTPLTIAKPTSNTTYYARWENGTNYSTCASVDVNVTAAPAQPVVTVNNTCGNSAFTITNGEVGASFDWTPTVADLNNVAAGTYTVTQTVGTCTSIASADVVAAPLAVPAQPVVTVNNTCGNSAFTITNGEVGASFDWTPAVADLNNVAAGTYTVTQTVGTCTSIASADVVAAPVTPVTPSVVIAADQTSVTAGTTVTFTPTPTNGGTPSYAYYVNGNLATTLSGAYSFAPANNDEVYVIMTSDLSCVTSATATSNTVTMIVTPAGPITSTFTGTGNWTDIARWNNGIPGAIDNAIISGNLTITGAATVASLTVENGASILGNDLLTVTGLTQAKRTITPNAWHLMSTSANGAKANSFYNNNLPPVYLQMFNNNGTWAGITDGDYVLTNGKGYSTWADNGIATATFNGNLNYGPVSVPVLMNTGLYGGWGFNLLGNPYPSAIDLDVLYSTNTQSSSFYTWNQANGQYSTYNAQTQIGQLGATNIIPANQGFFVNVAAAGNFTFMDAYRIHSITPLAKNTPANILRLNVQGNNLGDEAVITFNSNATNYYDFKYDSRKLMGSGDAPQMYTVVNGEKLSINSLSELIPNTSVSVPMNLEVGADGNYTITASELNSFTVNTTVYLIDSKTNQTINMSQNPVYNFTANTGDNANRFTVLFAATSGINSNNADNLVIFSHNNDVFVTNKGNETIREIQIMNALGQQIVKTGTESRISLNVETGYYFVKVITSGKTYTQKVFIH